MQCGANFFILDSRRVLAPAPKNAGTKTHLKSRFCLQAIYEKKGRDARVLDWSRRAFSFVDRIHSVQFSSVQFQSSVQFSSVQFSFISSIITFKVQFSSVRFSSVQFSSVLFCSAQFSSVRFSSVHCTGSTFLSWLRLMLAGIWLGLHWASFSFYDHHVQAEIFLEVKCQVSCKMFYKSLHLWGPHTKLRWGPPSAAFLFRPSAFLFRHVLHVFSHWSFIRHHDL